MSESTPTPASSPDYVLGHSDDEIERLKSQARIIDPITGRFLREAGLALGMRVLDVGSGAGDVAFLAAGIVGDSGEVLGVDRSAPALQAAAARARERSLGQVKFRVGDPAAMNFDQPFDAVIGRYVLQFQQDPAAMLRRLASHLKPGGLAVFHEIDWGGSGSFPAVPTYDRCRDWVMETLRRHGTESRMGGRLLATFRGAGLLSPTLRMEGMIGAGDGSGEVLNIFCGVVRTLLPHMEHQGVATAAQVGIDTLAQRIREEARATSSVLFGNLQIAAWSRV
jgi:protein-L-isoaspartate O-methyltransferase